MVVTSELFTDELIQAIDDWQSGSRNKQNKAEALKKASSHLPESYRKVPDRAYRQVRVNYKLGVGIATDAIPENVSSWTTCLEIAKAFRERDGNREKVMMIFARSPMPEDVILNLNAIYADPNFMETVKAAEARLGHPYKGITRWQNDQKEIVLEETIVGNDDIISIGAFRQLADVVPLIGTRAPNAPSEDTISHMLIGTPNDKHFWTSAESAAVGVKNAAESCRQFLQDKRLWPKDLQE